MGVEMSLIVGRRELILGGVGLALSPGMALAAPPPRLAFQVFRNGTKVGEHLMTFAGDDRNRTVTANVAMTAKVGPVPVYKYKHTAVEKWVDGKWASVETTMPGCVQITGPAGAQRGPAEAVPLSHWKSANFSRPLFNQQEGKLLKVRCTQVAPGHWQVRGDAEIDDFYDASGNWLALRGKLQDGSKMEYKRV